MPSAKRPPSLAEAPREPRRGYTQTRVFMDTTVLIELVAPRRAGAELAACAERAFAWFAEVEGRCTRFDESSELRALCRRAGEPVRASTLLFNALSLALEVARLSEGLFDPTVGRAMERAGFVTNYRTGERVSSSAEAPGPAPTYEDIHLDPAAGTVTLLRPMTLDLGAVAKGLAIDLAAEELRGLPGYAINAGGDVLARGHNADGEPWRIGVRHPRGPGELLMTLRITDAAVCTSGDYERRQPEAGHHLLDPGSGRAAEYAISATVVAPSAAAADALSTAAFVAGPTAGIDLLARAGAEGVIVGADLAVAATSGLGRYEW